MKARRRIPAFPAICCMALMAIKAQGQPLPDAVIKTEKWLHTLASENNSGMWWPNIRDSASSSLELYSGNCGVVLFYLELFYLTKNEKYLGIAEKGMRHMLNSLPDSITAENAGLYTGTAGILFTLHQFERAKGNIAFTGDARRLISALAKKMADTAERSAMPNDIIYGLAGIGLTFLYAAKNGLHQQADSMAMVIGDLLLERKSHAGTGLRWAMFEADKARGFYMPNFSHGTAGVAYYLVCLYERTKQEKYLQAARQAAAYLESISSAEGFVYHAEPDPEAMKRYYLGWCHGPAGTARLFYQLYRVTGEEKWKDKTIQLANSLMSCGIPEKRSAGFWNNAGYCCGDAGVAEFFQQLSVRLNQPAYLNFAARLEQDVLRRGTVNDQALYWMHAEHRSKPGLLQAQTGLMQGAAGIGLTLLHAYAIQNKKDYLVKLPDNPF
jgi:lantibiotic modifying enzyme